MYMDTTGNKMHEAISIFISLTHIPECISHFIRNAI